MSQISLELAQAMVAKYKDERPNILKEDLSTDILPLSITLPKEDIFALIDQDGCTQVRVYFGMQIVEPAENTSADKMIDVILVAVNDTGDDIIADPDAILIDQGTRCPPTCPANSGLNP